MKSILKFFRNETVLCVAFVLALLSCFFVQPDRTYIDYIDYRTLCILLCLMITMAGLQKLLLFRQIGECLVRRMSSIRGVVVILMFLCFFSSMWITNDVALITFVSFSITTLTLAKRKDLYIPVIVLDTVAANLGSMLTPLGNPQNLYLYSKAGLSFLSFIGMMLPYTLLSLLLLVIATLIFVKKEALEAPAKNTYRRSRRDKALMVLYLLYFLLSLLAVVRLMDYRIVFFLILGSVLLTDRRVLRNPDYSLLFTFIFLFVFIGNMKRIPALNDLLYELIRQREVMVSVILSQFISNVPTAILCSGFTERIPELIIGTNLGGLGTLIASMASLISFKQYGYVEGSDKKRYLALFTVMNLVFLAILLLFHYLFAVRI
ncbi:MAG: citrate transporter [Lachnospiraceae bacterium]|nr:citrate transporter [Lachnospiraceae bacterium]